LNARKIGSDGDLIERPICIPISVFPNPRQSAIKIMSDLIHNDITQKVIGCAFDVHNFLGNGFQEVVYQRALALELKQAGVEFERELEMDIFYRDFNIAIGTRRADFVVENKVLVELKALTRIEDVHLAQILNYLKAYRIEVGLLINFGSKSMEFKRVVLTKKSWATESRIKLFTRMTLIFDRALNWLHGWRGFLETIMG
jgi:GxxExxY protein